jgi:uncharacterized protein
MGGDWKEMFLGVETNDFALVQYYISKGIDLNYQHPEFLTSALIESIERNHLEMMEFLLQNGALPDLKEAFSFKSPMNIAKELKNKEAVTILNKYLHTNESIEEIHSLSILQYAYSILLKIVK